MSSHSSWFAGVCKECGYEIVVTQATEWACDYWWYCSNKECKNHHPGEQTGDMEYPTFYSREDDESKLKDTRDYT